MKLILCPRGNCNFNYAFALVMRDYHEIFPFDELESIELIASKSYIQSSHLATFKHKNGRRPKITIRNGNYSIPKFINFLVHELTHLEQHVSGRMTAMQEHEYEVEAYAAGKKAEEKYVGRF